MSTKLIALLVGIGMLGNTGGARADTVRYSADPQAMPVIQNILNWLYTLYSKDADKIMSGQLHASIINNIQNQTGYRPALLGANFNDESKWDDFQ